MATELERRIWSELQPDERLIWVGQPRADLVMRSACILVPFGLVFGAGAALWIAVAISMGNSEGPGIFNPFPLFGVPFVLVGLGLVLSPVWLGRKADRTAYALTNRRAIVWEPRLFGSFTVRSFTAAGLGGMSRRERRDGSGDLVFQEFVTHGVDSDGRRTATTTSYGFLAVNDVRHVEELVRRTLLY